MEIEAYESVMCYNVYITLVFTARKRNLEQGNVLHLCVIPFTGGSLSQHASQLTWQGVSVRGSLSGSLCPLGSLSRGVSVQGVSVWGVSVQGVSVQSGVSVWGVSVRGSLLGGSLSRRSLLGEGLCPGRSLSGRHPHMVISRQYTSYWNAFLFTLIYIYYIFGYLPSTNLYYTY